MERIAPSPLDEFARQILNKDSNIAEHAEFKNVASLFFQDCTCALRVLASNVLITLKGLASV